MASPALLKRFHLLFGGEDSLTRSRVSSHRWLDVLRHRLSVPDGSAGGDAEPARAGRDPPLVHYEAAEWLPRAAQQACGHVLLLLGGGHTGGTLKSKSSNVH